MGLLVAAYAGIERVEDPFVPDGDLCDRVTGKWLPQSFKVRKFAFWPHAAPEFTDGDYYVAQSEYKEFECTCTHYSGWRSKLAAMVGNPADNSFYELINFSDCEGVLGPSTCAKLAEDFRRWDQVAQQYERRGIIPRYDFYGMFERLKKTFEFAGPNGAVQFR